MSTLDEPVAKRIAKPFGTGADLSARPESVGGRSR